MTVAGGTVRAALDALEQRHPGIKERLCEGENLRSGLALIVDSQAAPLGLSQAVAEQSEIHFIPALGGG